MGNKSSAGTYDGLPPPIIPLDDGKKKKSKKEKKKKRQKSLDVEINSKKNGSTDKLAPTTATLFRSPRGSDEPDGQLSKVILPDQELDIKVYKKSGNDFNNTFERSRRYRSLPRSQSAGFRKSTDTLLSCESKQTDRQNHSYQQRYSSLAAVPSMTSRWSYNVGSNASTFQAQALKGIKFPDEQTILRNSAIFEKTFIECFVDRYYSSLPDIIKLSAVIVAYKRTFDQGAPNYRPISLRDYFLADEDRDLPSDLVSMEAKKWFVLAVPDVMATGLVRLKRRGQMDDWDETQVATSIDLVRFVTSEAAKELSRIYEYQISVICDATSVEVFGRHAAERSAEYLRSGNRFVERDSLIEGAAYLTPPSSSSHRNSFGSNRSQSPNQGFVSAIFGEDREQRWEISQIFVSCGLRLDRIHLCPIFMTSRDALPLIYGYRSPIFKRDFETGTENVSRTELSLFHEVLPDNHGDFHRDYTPMRIINLNCSSSCDSQSIGSQATDRRRQDGETPSGRCSRQSNSIPPGCGQRPNGFTRSGVRTSTLTSNGRYGMLARSMEFDREHHPRSPIHSKSFQRDSHSRQSERTPAVGGRFQKYSHARPERIANGNHDTAAHLTLRGATAGNGATTANHRMTVSNHHMNGSIQSLSRIQSCMNGDSAFVRNPTICTFKNTSPNHRQTLPETAHLANGNAAFTSKLPPKPPVRTVSCSQYNRHPNLPPSLLPNQNFVPHDVTVRVTSPRLPPTTETSFDCDVDDAATRMPPAPPAVEGSARSSMDFLDFKSFLKLVEQQNANLKSYGQNSATKLPDAVRHLETNFPEIDERPVNTPVISNV